MLFTVYDLLWTVLTPSSIVLYPQKLVLIWETVLVQIITFFQSTVLWPYYFQFLVLFVHSISSISWIVCRIWFPNLVITEWNKIIKSENVVVMRRFGRRCFIIIKEIILTIKFTKSIFGKVIKKYFIETGKHILMKLKSLNVCFCVW